MGSKFNKQRKDKYDVPEDIFLFEDITISRNEDEKAASPVQKSDNDRAEKNIARKTAKPSGETVKFERIFSSKIKNAAKRTKESDEDFFASLESFSKNDVETTVLPKKAKKTPLGLARGLMLLICLSVFVFSSFKLVQWRIDTVSAKNLYENIENMMNAKNELPKTKSSVVSAPTKTLLEILNSDNAGTDFTPPIIVTETLKTKYENFMSGIYNRYENVFAYLYIEGVDKDTGERIDIRYPVVKADDNDYYLYRDISGGDNTAGSIFADWRSNDKYSENRHVVMYGHNMSDGSMFRDIRKFFWPYDNYNLFRDTKITVITPEGIFTYKPFTMFETNKYDNYIEYDFYDDEEWTTFLEKYLSKNHYPAINGYRQYLKPSTKLLTFSTCTNVGDGRYVVQCVLTGFTPASEFN